jgi:Cys-rich protein (TIGR01571 family)
MTTIQKQDWHHSGSGCCSPIGTCMSSVELQQEQQTNAKQAASHGGAPAYSTARPAIAPRTTATCKATRAVTHPYVSHLQPTCTPLTCSQCMAFFGLGCLGVPFILPMMRRGDIRAKYHLKGNGCGDCLCACCCTPCDLTQQDKEVTYREESKHLLQPQPGKQDGMHYAQQPQQPHFHH